MKQSVGECKQINFQNLCVCAYILYNSDLFWNHMWCSAQCIYILMLNYYTLP